MRCVSRLDAHEFSKEYDDHALGFVFRRRVIGEVNAELIPVYAEELHQAAVENGREVLNRGFLTIPVRMRVHVRAVEPGVLELSCRLPLAATDEALEERKDELLDAMKMLGFDVVPE